MKLVMPPYPAPRAVHRLSCSAAPRTPSACATGWSTLHGLPLEKHHVIVRDGEIVGGACAAVFAR
jgi:hypothetical protein